jgi:hypothetical protein
MLHGRRGRSTSIFALSLAAMLVWTGAIADPAFAIHNRSRAFSIVNPERPVPGAPDVFTCRFIETRNRVQVYDYRCRNRDVGFEQWIMGPGKTEGDDALLVRNAGAEGDQTKLISPSRFTCNHRAGAGTSRLPRDFDCTDDEGRTFTLQDFAYSNPVDDEGNVDGSLTYVLPCRPCVVDQQP